MPGLFSVFDNKKRVRMDRKGNVKGKKPLRIKIISMGNAEVGKVCVEFSCSRALSVSILYCGVC